MTRFALLGLLGLVAADKPKPRTRNDVQTHVTASAVWVVYSISSTGTPDSVLVTVTGPSTQVKMFTGGTKKDSVSYPRPAEGDSIGGVETPLPFKKGVSYPQPASSAKAWGYREKVVPPTAKTDSLRVTSTSATVAPGQTVKLTAVVFQS